MDEAETKDFTPTQLLAVKQRGCLLGWSCTIIYVSVSKGTYFFKNYASYDSP